MSALRDDLVLFQDVMLQNGRLLVARGYKVSRALLEKLREFSEKPGIKELITVLMPNQ